MPFFSLFALTYLAITALGSSTDLSRYESLADCLASHSVPTLLPTSPNYTTDILPYNLRTPWTPLLLAIPSSAAQVSAAVSCTSKYSIKIAARSGGHSYAAYGLGGHNGSLVVDLKQFAKLQVDNETGIVEIGAGNRLGNIALGLHAQGRRALPHGLCPGVGISGHALHGGFGFTSRMWGTTLDTIVSMDVVLANGSITTASKTQNTDLFWALRGAGSSFGIVTNFKMETVPAPKNGVLFNYTFPTSTSISSKVAILTALQEYSLTAPPELALRILIVPPWLTFAASFQIYGVYWGTLNSFNTTISPLLRSWPDDTTSIITEKSYLDALVAFNAGGQLQQPEVYTAHDTFFATSVVTPEILSNASLTSFLTFAFSATAPAGLLWWVIGDFYGGVYSKISSFSPQDSAYAGRDAFYTFQLYSTSRTPPYPAEGIAFVKELQQSITAPQPETRFMAYPNYVDPTLSPTMAHRLYYGDNYGKLLEIKRTVDPEMRFWNPQAVGVE